MLRVSTLAVYCDRKMLWGLRRDNLRWTTPGGHLEEGEEPALGACRELAEETGMVARPEELRHLGTTGIVSRTGKAIELHMYRFEAGDREPKTHFDPDEEVHGWQWVDMQAGMPAGLASNMHSSPNVLLEKLGINTMRMSFMQRLAEKTDENTGKTGRTIQEVTADIQKAGTKPKPEPVVPEPKQKTPQEMEQNPADLLK